MKYKAYIDGQLAYTGNKIKYIKNQIDSEFKMACGACYAVIKIGKKTYADRRYDTSWHRW